MRRCNPSARYQRRTNAETENPRSTGADRCAPRPPHGRTWRWHGPAVHARDCRARTLDHRGRPSLTGLGQRAAPINEFRTDRKVASIQLSLGYPDEAPNVRPSNRARCAMNAFCRRSPRARPDAADGRATLTLAHGPVIEPAVVYRCSFIAGVED